MEITRIDPPCWFANMNNHVLQMIVYGKDLLGAHASLDYQHELKTNVISNTYSYLILNVDITNIKPNTSCVLQLKRNGEKVEEKYTFFPRRDKQIETLSVKDAIYLLMPDRFDVTNGKRNGEEITIDRNNPDCWHGGTIKGMTAHVADIADMGFSAIWHTPVFANRQKVSKDTKYYDYHGYAITDYYAIDPHFGNIEDYCNFVDTAHKKGVKVIMDMVFNHCGIDHPFVKNPPIRHWLNNIGNGKHKLTNFSPMTTLDRYASTYDKEHLVKGWFTPVMPDIDLSNEVVLNYMTQMSIWWVETTDIDAFRIDTYPYAGIEYMQEWQKRLYAEYPKFPILAEAWVGETEYVARMQSDNLSSIAGSTMMFMDFAFQRRVSDAISDKDARMVYSHFALDFAYKEPQNLLAFIDNHDVSRWLYKHLSIAELRQVVGLLLTVPRIPQIYYGTEILLAGDGKGTSDGNMRQDYPWSKPLDSKQRDFKDFLSELLKWRKDRKCITEGEMIHFVPLDDNVYIYFRFIKKDNGSIDRSESAVMVIINFSNEKKEFALSRFEELLSNYEMVQDVIDNCAFYLNAVNSITINANNIMILELK